MIWSAQELQETMETEIDRTALDAVLDAIAAVCREKAEHIRTNWQDERLAQSWERSATQVELVADSIRGGA